MLRLNSEQGTGQEKDASWVSTKKACCCEVGAFPKEFHNVACVAEAWCIP